MAQHSLELEGLVPETVLEQCWMLCEELARFDEKGVDGVATARRQLHQGEIRLLGIPPTAGGKQYVA